MKCYRINVTMKNGFKYSYTCIARMMPGMKTASEGYWTESIEVTEITEKEHQEANHCVFEDEPKTVKRKKVEKITVATEVPPEKIPKGKKSKIAFSSLENFFDGGDPAPENKKLKKRV